MASCFEHQSLQGFRYFSLDIFQALIPPCHCCEAGAANWLGFSLPTYLSFMMLPPQSCRAGAAHRSEYYVGFTNYAAICRLLAHSSAFIINDKTSCLQLKSGSEITPNHIQYYPPLYVICSSLPCTALYNVVMESVQFSPAGVQQSVAGPGEVNISPWIIQNR